MDVQKRIERLEEDATATFLALQLLSQTLTPEQKADLRSRAGSALGKHQAVFAGKEGTELAVRRLLDSLFS